MVSEGESRKGGKRKEIEVGVELNCLGRTDTS